MMELKVLNKLVLSLEYIKGQKSLIIKNIQSKEIIQTISLSSYSGSLLSIHWSRKSEHFIVIFSKTIILFELINTTKFYWKCMQEFAISELTSIDKIDLAYPYLFLQSNNNSILLHLTSFVCKTWQLSCDLKNTHFKLSHHGDYLSVCGKRDTGFLMVYSLRNIFSSNSSNLSEKDFTEINVVKADFEEDSEVQSLHWRPRNIACEYDLLTVIHRSGKISIYEISLQETLSDDSIIAIALNAAINAGVVTPGKTLEPSSSNVTMTYKPQIKLIKDISNTFLGDLFFSHGNYDKNNLEVHFNWILNNLTVPRTPWRHDHKPTLVGSKNEFNDKSSSNINHDSLVNLMHSKSDDTNKAQDIWISIIIIQHGSQNPSLSENLPNSSNRSYHASKIGFFGLKYDCVAQSYVLTNCKNKLMTSLHLFPPYYSLSLTMNIVSIYTVFSSVHQYPDSIQLFSTLSLRDVKDSPGPLDSSHMFCVIARFQTIFNQSNTKWILKLDNLIKFPFHRKTAEIKDKYLNSLISYQFDKITLFQKPVMIHKTIKTLKYELYSIEHSKLLSKATSLASPSKISLEGQITPVITSLLNIDGIEDIFAIICSKSIINNQYSYQISLLCNETLMNNLSNTSSDNEDVRSRRSTIQSFLSTTPVSSDRKLINIDIIPDLHFGLGLRLDESKEEDLDSPFLEDGSVATNPSINVPHYKYRIIIASFKSHPITKEPMAAELSKKIILGDELIGINDVFFQNQPLSSVIPMIRNILASTPSNNTITLRVARKFDQLKTIDSDSNLSNLGGLSPGLPSSSSLHSLLQPNVNSHYSPIEFWNQSNKHNYYFIEPTFIKEVLQLGNIDDDIKEIVDIDCLSITQVPYPVVSYITVEDSAPRKPSKAILIASLVLTKKDELYLRFYTVTLLDLLYSQEDIRSRYERVQGQQIWQSPRLTFPPIAMTASKIDVRVRFSSHLNRQYNSFINFQDFFQLLSEISSTYTYDKVFRQFHHEQLFLLVPSPKNELHPIILPYQCQYAYHISSTFLTDYISVQTQSPVFSIFVHPLHVYNQRGNRHSVNMYTLSKSALLSEMLTYTQLCSVYDMDHGTCMVYDPSRSNESLEHTLFQQFQQENTLQYLLSLISTHFISCDSTSWLDRNQIVMKKLFVLSDYLIQQHSRRRAFSVSSVNDAPEDIDTPHSSNTYHLFHFLGKSISHTLINYYQEKARQYVLLITYGQHKSSYAQLIQKKVHQIPSLGKNNLESSSDSAKGLSEKEGESEKERVIGEVVSMGDISLSNLSLLIIYLFSNSISTLIDITAPTLQPTKPAISGIDEEVSSVLDLLKIFIKTANLDSWAFNCLLEVFLQQSWVCIIDHAINSLETCKSDIFTKNIKSIDMSVYTVDDDEELLEDSEKGSTASHKGHAKASNLIKPLGGANSSENIGYSHYQKLSMIQCSQLFFSNSQSLFVKVLFNTLIESTTTDDASPNNSNEKAYLDIGQVFFQNPKSSINQGFQTSLPSPASNPKVSPFSIITNDIFQYLVDMKIAFWCHDLSPFIDIIYKYSMLQYKQNKSAMQIFLEMVLIGKSDRLLLLAKADNSSSGKQLLTLLAMVEEVLDQLRTPASTLTASERSDLITQLQLKLKKNALALIKKQRYRDALAVCFLLPNASMLKFATSILVQQYNQPLLGFFLFRILEYRFVYTEPWTTFTLKELFPDKYYDEYRARNGQALGIFSAELLEKDILPQLLNVIQNIKDEWQEYQSDNIGYFGLVGYSAVSLVLISAVWLQKSEIVDSLYSRLSPIIHYYLTHFTAHLHKEMNEELPISHMSLFFSLYTSFPRLFPLKVDENESNGGVPAKPKIAPNLPNISLLTDYLERCNPHCAYLYELLGIYQSLSFLYEFSAWLGSTELKDELRSWIQSFHHQHHLIEESLYYELFLSSQIDSKTGNMLEKKNIVWSQYSNKHFSYAQSKFEDLTTKDSKLFTLPSEQSNSENETSLPTSSVSEEPKVSFNFSSFSKLSKPTPSVVDPMDSGILSDSFGASNVSQKPKPAPSTGSALDMFDAPPSRPRQARQSSAPVRNMLDDFDVPAPPQRSRASTEKPGPTQSVSIPLSEEPKATLKSSNPSESNQPPAVKNMLDDFDSFSVSRPARTPTKSQPPKNMLDDFDSFSISRPSRASTSAKTQPPAPPKSMLDDFDSIPTTRKSAQENKITDSEPPSTLVNESKSESPKKSELAKSSSSRNQSSTSVPNMLDDFDSFAPVRRPIRRTEPPPSNIVNQDSQLTNDPQEKKEVNESSVSNQTVSNISSNPDPLIQSKDSFSQPNQNVNPPRNILDDFDNFSNVRRPAVDQTSSRNISHDNSSTNSEKSKTEALSSEPHLDIPPPSDDIAKKEENDNSKDSQHKLKKNVPASNIFDDKFMAKLKNKHPKPASVTSSTTSSPPASPSKIEPPPDLDDFSQSPKRIRDDKEAVGSKAPVNPFASKLNPKPPLASNSTDELPRSASKPPKVNPFLQSTNTKPHK